MLTSRFLPLLATATLVVPLALTGCSGSDKAGTPAPSASATDTPSPTPTPTPPATTAAPSTPPPAPKPRTAPELTKALLALTDLPSGFSIETDAGDGGADVKVSSKKAACARLVAISNADSPPGSKASATRSFSGGQEGPFIDESIDAMGSAKAVAALQTGFRKAIRACSTLTLTIPGQGRSAVAVREVSAPPSGTDPVAVRFTATGGPLEGLEVIMVTTGVDDTVLALTFVASLPDDVDGATDAAVTKALQTLGATTSGT